MSHPNKTSDVLLIGATLGFATGVVLSIMLFNLLRRSRAGQPGARAKYLQVVFALMWNLGGLIGELGLLAGASPRAPWMLAAAMVNYSGGAFFPVSFLALWQPPLGEKSQRARLCLALCALTILSAAGLTFAFMAQCIGAGIVPELAGTHRLGKLLAWHVAGAMVAGTFLLWHERSNNFAARFYTAMAVLGISTPAVISLCEHFFAWHERAPDWARIAEQQAPLLILLGAVVYFGDFRFSNVYIKSSGTFMQSLILALLFCLLAIYAAPPLAARLTAFPIAATVIALTMLLTALLCGFAWFMPKHHRWVDGWLFREPNYAAATRQVWQALSQKNQDEAVLASAASLAREMLALAETKIVPLSVRDAGSFSAALNSGEVCELRAGDAWRNELGEEFEFLAPIRVGGQVTHALAVAPGAQRRKLLDSELNFLRGLAGQASSRLETLVAERERIAQQSREERLRRQVTEAELRALRTQINPHFLFNSLNTIADLIVADPTQAERVTVQLAKIFRYVLRSSDRQMISINEELDFLKTWLDIEAVRFGDRLRVQFAADETLAVAQVPSLILQPLVENALKHGLAPKLAGGTLQVAVARAGEQIRLTVEDDGLGFPCHPAALTETTDAPDAATRTNGNGIGLRNVAERLTTIYAGRAQMLCETVAAGGSRVTLLLPLEV